jgi:hypothetical protein
VATGGQDEPRTAAEQPGAAIAGLPGAEMVGGAGDQVGAHVDLGQVDRRAEHGGRAGPGEGVADGEPHQVAVQAGGHPGRVSVPVQDVEGRWRPPPQVVVDPVVPDQIPRTQPREHLGQGPAVQVSPCRRGGNGRPGGALVERRSGRPRPGLVEHGHRQAEPGDPVLAANRGQVGQGHGGQDSARAQSQQRRPVGPADPPSRLQRVQDRLPVGVGVPVAVAGVGIAPGDDENLLAAVDQVLDQAASWGEVDDVVLVDRRRDDQQWHPADPWRPRPVLEQLEDGRAQHDRPGGDGQVGAHLEGVGGHHGRDPWWRGQVGGQVPGAADQADAAGVDQCLPKVRTGQRLVAGGQRLDQVVGREPQPLGVAPCQVGVGQELLGGPPGGQVGLQEAAQQWVGRPGGIGETAVGGCRGQAGAAEADPGQLARQGGRPAGDSVGPAGQGGGEPGARAARCEAARRPERAGGEQQVQGRSRGVGARRPGADGWPAAHGDSPSGGTTSRRRSLPVAVLGRAASSHTCRGYL